MFYLLEYADASYLLWFTKKKVLKYLPFYILNYHLILIPCQARLLFRFLHLYLDINIFLSPQFCAPPLPISHFLNEASLSTIISLPSLYHYFVNFYRLRYRELWIITQIKKLEFLMKTFSSNYFLVINLRVLLFDFSSNPKILIPFIFMNKKIYWNI